MDRNAGPRRLDTRVTQSARRTANAPQPVAGKSLEVSATVTGFDGAVIGSVTRHREPGPGEPDPVDPALAPDLIVVSVDGDLDADTGPVLHIALTEALHAGARVCCDLSRVTFFGADGANVVVAAHLRATAIGSQFTLRGVRGITRQVLAITRLDETLTFV